MKNTIVSILKVICLSLSCLLVNGCGTFGGTKVVNVQISNLPRGPLASIHTGTVALAPDATKLDSVGVYPVGKFSARDLANIKTSLNKAFCTIQQTQGVDNRNLNIHVIIRRYLVAASNNSGATLACVAWCAVDQDNQIVYDEQFYASASVSFGTLGGNKNKVNRAIVSRITEMSAYMASPMPKKRAMRFPENAYANFSTATRDLPKRFQSYYFANGGGYSTFATLGENAMWEWAEQKDRINWARCLNISGYKE